ncbi:hypothetical protein MRX96_025880 [Rhipicephalus microplus]
MPAGDTNATRSSRPPRRLRRRPGLPTRTSVYKVLPPGGVPAWPCLPPTGHLLCPSCRSPRVPGRRRRRPAPPSGLSTLVPPPAQQPRPGTPRRLLAFLRQRRALLALDHPSFTRAS